jgi:hypothetical protein
MAEEEPNHVANVVAAMVTGGLSAMTRAELHVLKPAIDSGGPLWLKLHEALGSFAASLAHVASLVELPQSAPAEQPVEIDDTEGMKRYLGVTDTVN